MPKVMSSGLGLRIQLAKLVFSQAFEMVMGALILGNLILIWYETGCRRNVLSRVCIGFHQLPYTQ